MEEIWSEIEKWLKNNAVEVYDELAPGANSEDLRNLEQNLDIELPENIKTSYRIHDGTKRYKGLIGSWSPLGLKTIEKKWSLLKKLHDQDDMSDIKYKTRGSVRSEWWNPKWIPLFDNGSGDFYCIDLDPSEGGKVGQIVIYWHDTEKREVVAVSFEELLKTFAGDLKAGVYQYNEKKGIYKTKNKK